jgi:hypothetical protein
MNNSSGFLKGIIYNIFEMKKVLLTLFATGILLSTGCKMNCSVGPKANPPWLDAKVNKEGVSVTVPFVKTGVEVDD